MVIKTKVNTCTKIIDFFFHNQHCLETLNCTLKLKCYLGFFSQALSKPISKFVRTFNWASNGNDCRLANIWPLEFL